MNERYGVSNSIAKTESFIARRNILCGYVYALVRVLEYASAWISTTADVDFKIALGQQIGFDAEDIFRIQRRILTLLTERVVPIAAAEYEDKLACAAGLQSVSEKSDFLTAVLSGLALHMESFVSTANSIGDAPTVCVLNETVRSISAQVDLLSPFSRTKYSLAFIEPSTSEEIKMYSGSEPVPALLDRPARPADWVFCDAQVFSHRSNADLIERGEHLRRWLHEVGINVEINAMELCGRNIVEFREMPIDFKLDMARQIWDETRHAQMMRAQLRALGGDFGDYTYNDKVWRKYILGDGLAERLAIEQVFQEGNALEGNIPFCEVLRDANACDLAEMLDYVDADELQHAYFGNKWLKFLCNESDDGYMKTLNIAAGKLGTPLRPRAPLLLEVRQMAGFPQDFIQLMAAAD